MAKLTRKEGSPRRPKVLPCGTDDGNPQSDACPWRDLDQVARGLSLDHYLSSTLVRLAAAIQSELISLYVNQSNDLSVPEWRLLARLAQSSPMQLSDLCRLSYVDRAYVSRLLKPMAARQLVTLTPDPNNRRRLIVEITEQGRAVAQQIFPAAVMTNTRLLATLTEKERVTLFQTLHKLMNFIDGQELQNRLRAGDFDSDSFGQTHPNQRE